MTEGQERQFVYSLDEILRAVVRQDEESVYRLLAKSLKDLLQAEAGAVFLVPPEAPGHLRLVSQYADGFGHEFPHWISGFTARPGGASPVGRPPSTSQWL